MTEPLVPMHTCRPQGATLCKVLSLKHTEIYPTDNISYVIKKRNIRYYLQILIRE